MLYDKSKFEEAYNNPKLYFIYKEIEKIKGIKSITTNSFLVKGDVPVRDLNREINIELPTTNASSIAGLIIYESRTIPKSGQIFSFYKIKFEIIAKKGNQITLLKITKKKAKIF